MERRNDNTNNKKLAKATLHLSTHAKRKSNKDHFQKLALTIECQICLLRCAQIEKIKNILSAKLLNFYNL